MEKIKSVLLIAPTDRKFKINFSCKENENDLESVRKAFEQICLKDLALRQIFDRSESHFIFKKYDDFFKCEIEVTDADDIEHGSIFHVTILSNILADITLSQSSPVVNVQPEEPNHDEVSIVEKETAPASSARKIHKPVDCVELLLSEKYSQKVAFFIVQFQDTKEVDVVPASWLNKDVTMCYYPNYKSAIKLVEAVQTVEDVGQGWKVRPVKGSNEFESYEMAVKHLPEFILTVREEQTTEQRKSSFVGAANGDEDKSLTAAFTCSSLFQTVKEEYLSNKAEENPMTSIDDILSQAAIISNFQIENVEDNFLMDIHESFQSDIHFPSKELEKCCKDCKQIASRLLLGVRWKLLLNTVLMKRLLGLRGSSTVDSLVPSYSPPFELPLSTFEDIEAFNRYLEKLENFNASVSYFGRFAGISTKKTVKTLLQELINGKTATSYNWKGRGYKKPFKDMKKICELIYAVCKSNSMCCDTTLIDVSNHIKTWFRFAIYLKENEELRKLQAKQRENLC